MNFRIFLAILFLSPELCASETSALLAFVQGTVLINEKAATKGQTVRSGMRLQTKPESSCTLLIGRSTVVRIGPDSDLKVTEILSGKESGEESSDIDLKHGQLRALVAHDLQVRKKLRVKTRSSVMGVRGTDIYIHSPENLNEQVQFVTLEGVAEVTLPVEGPHKTESVTLRENQALIPGGEPTTLKPGAIESLVEDVASSSFHEEDSKLLEFKTQELEEFFDTNLQETIEEKGAEEAQASGDTITPVIVTVDIK